MCLPKDKPQFPNKPKTPRSPWRRLRQHIKPRLNRRVVPSAKINLNDFWSKFEQMAEHQAPLMTFHSTATTFDNEINDNLHNELMELNH